MKYTDIKTVMLTVFLITIPMVGLNAGRKTPGSPDFAFPKTVEIDSRRKLEQALHANKPVEALRAVINLSIASSQISAEKSLPLLQEIDSISNTLPEPFGAIGLLLEAQIYANIYQANRFTYNSRTVAENMSDDNPEFWDKNIFRQRIDSLATLALHQKKAAEKLPLSRLTPIITPAEDLDAFTVYDFIVYKYIELTSLFSSSAVIPFFETPDNTNGRIQLLDGLLALHPEDSTARLCALMHKTALLPEAEQAPFLWEQIKAAGESSLAAHLLIYYASAYGLQAKYETTGIPDTSELYRYALYLKNSIKDIKTVAELDELLCYLRNVNISIDFPSLASSNTPLPVSVISHNCKEFYVLLLKLNKESANRFTPQQLSAQAVVVSAKKISFSKEIPFNDTVSISFEAPAPGTYTIVASTSPEIKDVIIPGSYLYPDFINVSDIEIIRTDITNQGNNREPGIQSGVFVVNASDGSPIVGAEIKFTETGYWRNGRTPKTEVVKTDSRGFASTGLKSADVEASYQGSMMKSSVFSSTAQKDTMTLHCRLFTDRQIYRPGDKLSLMGILYTSDALRGCLVTGRSITVELHDANGEMLDSISLVSDDSGRIFGEFHLPEDGLRGSWSLRAGNGYRYFNVENYKAPSFFIALEKGASAPDSISFDGIVSTYSGMPVANTKVDYTVNYAPAFFFYRDSNGRQSYSSTVETDSEGKFKITLPLGRVSASSYRGTFTISASATDEAGESVESAALPFRLAETYNIRADFPTLQRADSDELKLKVSVENAAGYPVQKDVHYDLISENGKIINHGTFRSPYLNIAAVAIPSGRYTIDFSLVEDSDVTISSPLTVYRSSDTIPPFETTLWVPVNHIVTKTSENFAEITYGSSFCGQNILCSVSDSKGNVFYRWLVSDGRIATFKVEAPKADEQIYVTFSASRNHEFNSYTVTVIPEAQTERFEIETETFRTSLEPGSSEQWRFKLSYAEKPVEGYAYAVLYDKSLDAIAPLQWNANLFSARYRNPLHIDGIGYFRSVSWFNGSQCSVPSITVPQYDFETYGYPLYSGVNRIRNLMATRNSTAKMASGRPTELYAMADDADGAVMTESVMEARSMAFGTAADVAEEGSATEETVDFRPSEMPVAFFRPDLTSDAEGTVIIDFTVPDFNTTWKFMMGAYSNSLASSSITLEAVASKTVMVKMLAPRFLRTGDKAVITATVYNNADTALNISSVIEVFNPLTGEIISRSKPEERLYQPSADGVVSVGIECPSALNAIGLRVYAKAEGCSDGEQTIIPVLPSSQPVIETEPFYLSPNEQTVELTMPKFPDYAKVTFTYCDNPVWEAVSALSPIISPDCESITELANALFANCTGTGLIKTNPNIRRGLQMILEGEGGDSLLVSNLQKNSDLKNVALANTPWVNDASGETLRLMGLQSLINDSTAYDAISDIWKKIGARQGFDGGWAWWPGMKSSSRITESVVLNIGILQNAGFLPKLPELNKRLNNAFGYIEGEYVDSYNRWSGNKDGFLASLLTYLYAQSFFPDHEPSFSMKRIKKEAHSYLSAHWKNLSIGDKAIAAIVLHRENFGTQALEVLESLRQFASQDPRKGVWFDNLSSAFGGAGKLLITAQVLMAFEEIAPKDPLIDGMRQWLLLQRQTQDWQEGFPALMAITALLNSGTEWTGNYAPPVIKIGNGILESSEISALTGQLTVTLDPTDCKGKMITISRLSPTPAWGGTICQYVAPIVDVRANAIPDLSITKSIWKIVDSATGIKAEECNELAVGDKVRVTLIIDCGRDMDFVALTDERAACLEPLDQLSAYTGFDGLWAYREMRNSSTGIFFDFLPRGRHIISYECRVMEEGDFSCGIATLQCLYAPLLTAHSAGSVIRVR